MDLAILLRWKDIICSLRNVTLRSFDTVGLHNRWCSAATKAAVRDCKSLFLSFFKREPSAMHAPWKNALCASHNVEKSETVPTLNWKNSFRSAASLAWVISDFRRWLLRRRWHDLVGVWDNTMCDRGVIRPRDRGYVWFNNMQNKWGWNEEVV